MDKDEMNKLIEKYLAGTATNAERQFLNQWYTDFDDSQAIIPSDESKQEVKARVWNQVARRIELQERLKATEIKSTGVTYTPTHFRLSYLKWAAMIILVVGLGISSWQIFFPGKPDTIAFKQEVTNRGERKKLTLADGSIVWLNADSQLKYPVQFGNSFREVYLSGEAFFEIAHNPAKPFLVHTSGLTTRVVGTSFNVKAYAGASSESVSVATGKVMVAPVQKVTEPSKPAGNTLLTPNQQVTLEYKSNHLVRATVSNGFEYANWREGTLYFDQTPMQEVTEAISRKYNVNVRIENPQLYNCQLFGKYKDQPLKSLLDVICELTDARYQIKGKEVIITGEGCMSKE